MKKYLPDEPKEISFIASSVARLGAAMSGITLFQEHKGYTLTSIFLTWIGYEISSYIKLHESENNNPNTTHHD